jgi:DNA polymerase-4
MRKIIHVDMDAFYASVEQRDHPEYRGKPVIVGGSPEQRGVVTTASYEARKFGVHSAIPTSRAKRLCPDGIFVHPHFEKYREVSRQIREIFQRHTPLVEPLSLDEAYLDVTEELTGIATATETAEVIRREIREETHLTASAGVAPNKFLAKIASDWNKPDGLFVIKPSRVLAFLEPLPVGKLPGVGRVTEGSMHELGLFTVGDIRLKNVEWLTGHFGRYGERLWELAYGIDESPVEPGRVRKSVSSETTFAHDLPMDALPPIIRDCAADVWKTVEKKELSGKTVTVKLRAADFTTATRRRTLDHVVATVEELGDVALELTANFGFGEAAKYRLVGVGISNFAGEEQEEDGKKAADQESLFPE